MFYQFIPISLDRYRFGPTPYTTYAWSRALYQNFHIDLILFPWLKLIVLTPSGHIFTNFMNIVIGIDECYYYKCNNNILYATFGHGSGLK